MNNPHAPDRPSAPDPEPVAGEDAQAATGTKGPDEPDETDGEGQGPPSPVGRLAATVERLRREVQKAQAEADGRALIELAKGILVERLGCGPSQAARQLAELTGQAGVTPLEFAVEVINQAARDRLSDVPMVHPTDISDPEAVMLAYQSGDLR